MQTRCPLSVGRLGRPQGHILLPALALPAVVTLSQPLLFCFEFADRGEHLLVFLPLVFLSLEVARGPSVEEGTLSNGGGQGYLAVLLQVNCLTSLDQIFHS